MKSCFYYLSKTLQNQTKLKAIIIIELQLSLFHRDLGQHVGVFARHLGLGDVYFVLMV